MAGPMHEIPDEVVREIDRALTVADFWFNHLCDQLNIDREMTKAHIRAVGISETRELAQVPLSRSLAQINEARANLADAIQDSEATEA